MILREILFELVSDSYRYIAYHRIYRACTLCDCKLKKLMADRSPIRYRVDVERLPVVGGPSAGVIANRGDVLEFNFTPLLSDVVGRTSTGAIHNQTELGWKNCQAMVLRRVRLFS